MSRPTIKLIAAVAEDGGLGFQGGLLFHIPEDLHHFKELTTGHAVIMGRGTLDSLPGGRPLPHRRNLVLTHQDDFTCEGVEVFHSVDEVLSALDGTDEAWVMGGASVYAQFLPFADELYLTEVQAVRPADCFFPEIGPEWEVKEQEEHQSGGIAFQFVRYCRKKD